MALTREKAIDFVKKLRLQAESEEKLQNLGTAELFTEKADDLILKYGLLEEDLTIISTSQIIIVNEVGKTIVSNPFLRQNARKNLRQEWFELLAESVAKNYKCKTLAQPDGTVTFYGYDLDREMAIFIFLRLADVAERISKKEVKIAEKNVGKKAMKDFATGEMITFPAFWNGEEKFFDSFHFGFRNSLKELHERLQNGIIPQEVEEFFKNENPYYTPQLDVADIYSIVPEYIRIGEKAGRVAFKKSTSSTAIVSKKAANKIKEIVEGQDTVILAIDTSGSMNSYGKLSQAKEGAINFARTSIEKGYKVGIICFDSHAKVISHPEDRLELLEDKIQTLSAGGCTDMAAGIRISIPFFSARRKKKAVICIVTDGKPETYRYDSKDDIEETLKAASGAKKLGIEIMCVGTDGANEEFLQKLSSREGLALLVERSQLLLSIGEMANNLR